jgi:hypothetical protein
MVAIGKTGNQAVLEEAETILMSRTESLMKKQDTTFAKRINGGIPCMTGVVTGKH